MRILAKIVAGIVIFEIADHLYPRLGAPDWMSLPAAMLTIVVIVLALRPV